MTEFHCKRCKRDFPSRVSLQMHTQRKHGNLRGDTRNRKPGDGPKEGVCPICGKTMKNIHSHIKEVHGMTLTEYREAPTVKLEPSPNGTPTKLPTVMSTILEMIKDETIASDVRLKYATKLLEMIEHEA